MNLVEKVRSMIEEDKKVLLDNIALESMDDIIIIKKDGNFIHETKSALAALWFLTDKKMIKNQIEVPTRSIMDMPFTHAIANSAKKSDLDFNGEIQRSLEEKVNLDRTIMEVEKSDGSRHVLRANFLASSMRIRPGDMADCPGLGLGVRERKIIRLSKIFNNRVLTYYDKNNNFNHDGKGLPWDEFIKILK